MGRSRQAKNVKYMVEEALSSRSKSPKKEPNRDIRLATNELKKEINESMRIFRRKYKLPQVYNNNEDS